MHHDGHPRPDSDALVKPAPAPPGPMGSGGPADPAAPVGPLPGDVPPAPRKSGLILPPAKKVIRPGFQINKDGKAFSVVAKDKGKKAA